LIIEYKNNNKKMSIIISKTKRRIELNNNNINKFINEFYNKIIERINTIKYKSQNPEIKRISRIIFTEDFKEDFELLIIDLFTKILDEKINNKINIKEDTELVSLYLVGIIDIYRKSFLEYDLKYKTPITDIMIHYFFLIFSEKFFLKFINENLDQKQTKSIDNRHDIKNLSNSFGVIDKRNFETKNNLGIKNEINLKIRELGNIELKNKAKNKLSIDNYGVKMCVNNN